MGDDSDDVHLTRQNPSEYLKCVSFNPGSISLEGVRVSLQRKCSCPCGRVQQNKWSDVVLLGLSILQLHTDHHFMYSMH